MTAPTALSDLFTDWGGFEQFVAELHRTGSVTVEHNVTLTGRSGAPRQIDVLVRHKEGLYEHLIVVECKYRKSPLARHHVDAMETTIREVGASRGVIFSTNGFQRGAIEQAAAAKIGLFQIRPLEDDEWGRPGRHLDLWLHLIGFSIGNLEMPGSMRAGPPLPGPLPLALDATDGGRSSITPLEIPGRPKTTLEELLLRTARASAEQLCRPVVLDFDGAEEGELLRKIKVRIKPDQAAEVTTMGTVLLLPEITYELGVKITQSRICIDRGSDYAFVLAVEDCISRTMTIASRGQADDHTTLTDTHNTPAGSKPYENGSIASFWLRGPLPFSRFDDVPLSTGPGMQMPAGALTDLLATS